MTTLAIWLGAALLYGAFWTWYVGFRPRLTPAEVERYMARLPAETAEPERRERMRGFLAADDGREFFMVNLIRLQPEPVRPPGGGEPASAAEVLAGYTGPFLRALFRRGGHPALGGRAAAGYLEEWGVEKNPGWTMSGIIRYRSRRDLIELASAPQFAPIHVFKRAGIANTLAFPIAPARLFFSPRVVAALALALAASLLTLAVRG
ncbi:MAG TPA: hypothetical protein VMR86_19170 [Myxococcota bacterium]|nr:hypothetical protein [Myxococcota bacterium]